MPTQQAKYSQRTIRAAAALAGATEQNTDAVEVPNQATVTFEVSYTRNDPLNLNALKMRPEVRNDAGAWVPANSATDTGAPSAGVVEIELLIPVYKMTVTGVRVFDVSVHAFSAVRLAVWEDGGGAAGACTVKASPSHRGV